MTLKDDLQEIDGVGEKTAEKILDVVESHEMGVSDAELKRVIGMLNRGASRAARSKLEALVE